jgi:phospholipid/cholesterol/gamma-HCH transport system permease protein
MAPANRRRRHQRRNGWHYQGVLFRRVGGRIGCLRGLQTKSGPSAVGISTTRSVVTSIFFIVLVDAVFAVVYFAIDF